MIQLNLLSGSRRAPTRLPAIFFRVGRAPGNELAIGRRRRLGPALTIEFQTHLGFNLTTAPNALVTVNGEPAQNITLRNGDTISVGSVKLQFWLAAARQAAARPRKSCVDAAGLVTLSQFVLLYWLLGAR